MEGMDVLQSPEDRFVRDDNPEEPPRATRKTGELKVERSSRFVVPAGQDFEKQYAQTYYVRYLEYKGRVLEAAGKKWGRDLTVAKQVLDVDPQKRCIIVGTIYKDMPLKPNILDEFHARENYEAPPPERSKYNSDDDNLVLEDMSGRIALVGDVLDVGTLVSGVTLAALGKTRPSGEFEVEDVCYPGLPGGKYEGQLPPRLPAIPPCYVCLLSGLNISKDDTGRVPLQMMSDFIQGNLGAVADQELAAKIVHVIVAGNLVWQLDDDHQDLPQYKKRNMVPESVAHMKEVDLFVAQLGINVPVDLMSGPHDPSDAILPQQPMHPCMFPLARNVSGVKGETNPYEAAIAGRRFLGSSGQGIDDIYRFSTEEDRLKILERTLDWGHLCPTAPDSLGCFPFSEGDPFMIKDCPHVYFAGNQPSFATKTVQGPTGPVRLVCVPSFSDTHTIVLLNLATMECEPLCFSGPQ